MVLLDVLFGLWLAGQPSPETTDTGLLVAWWTEFYGSTHSPLVALSWQWILYHHSMLHESSLSLIEDTMDELADPRESDGDHSNLHLTLDAGPIDIDVIVINRPPLKWKWGCSNSSVWDNFTDDRKPQKAESDNCKHCNTRVSHHKKSETTKCHKNNCSKNPHANVSIGR